MKRASQSRSTASNGNGSRTDWAVAVWVIFSGALCILAMSAAMGLFDTDPRVFHDITQFTYLLVLVSCIASVALRLTQRLQNRRDGS